MKMPKYASAGIAHYLIFTGFATLLLRTIILVGRGFDESFYLFILDPQGPDPLLRATMPWTCRGPSPSSRTDRS